MTERPDDSPDAPDGLPRDDPETVAQLTSPAVPTLQLVVRLMAAVYSRLPIEIVAGPEHADITLQGARVSYPEPFDTGGMITKPCLNWIIEAVKTASAKLRLRMCIVADDAALYVEPSGRTVASTTKPAGGIEITPIIDCREVAHHA